MTTDLLKPILSGIKHTNFFEGRLLTGRDLREQQIADRGQRNRLGRIISTGIVSGFDITIEKDGSDGMPPVLKVLKGLAINAVGQVLELEKNHIMLRLSRELEIPESPETFFKECLPPTTSAIPNGAGLYLLVMSPAKVYEDYAPKSGLQTGGISSECGKRYIVDGIQFRLVEYDPTTLAGLPDNIIADLRILLTGTNPAKISQPERLSKLRNLVAHICLGSWALTNFAADPFAKTAGKSVYLATAAMNQLLQREDGIGDCDVPLGLIYWTAEGIGFFDHWSVRRRVYARSVSKEWPILLGSPLTSESEAGLLQFQEHVEWLRTHDAVDPRSIAVEDYFDFLPPVGVLPLISESRPNDFSRLRFFGSYMIEPPKKLTPSQFPKVVYNGLYHGIIDLRYTDFIQLYEIDSLKLIGTQSYTPYLIFADPHVAYISSEPRFSDLCSSLKDARDAYQDLIEKDVFLSGEINPASTPARTRVIGAIQYVVMTATGWASAACSRMTAFSETLPAMQDLYNAQKVLTSTFLGPLPGLHDRSKLRSFAGQLLVLLDGPVSGGFDSLNEALDQGQLPEIVAAQNRINQLVATWTGGATTGNLEVIYQSSTRGRTLVVDDPDPFNFIFRVINRTNRSLDIQLASMFLAPHDGWTDAIALLDMDGSEIRIARLDPFDSNHPEDPAAMQDIQASIITPDDAAIGDTPTLRMRAFVPVPVSVADNADLSLVVGDTEVPEEGTRVEVPPPTPSHDIGDASENVPITLTFNILYHTDEGPPSRDFTLTINVLSPETEELYFIQFPADPFELVNDVRQPQTAQIMPLAGALGTSLTFEAVVRSVDGEIEETVGPYELSTVHGAG